MAEQDYEASLRAAEQELRSAASAEDVRVVWRRHFGVLGHRTLGRLLLGRPAAELLARRDSRADRD